MVKQDFLPPEYQAQIDEQQRKKRLADLFVLQGFNNSPQGQMVSGHYVKPNWMQYLAPLASVLAGYKGGEKAQAAMGTIGQNAVQARTNELAGIQAMPDPKKAMEAAQRSQWPAIQKLGEAMREEQERRVSAMQKEIAERVSVNDIASVYEGQTGGFTPKSKYELTQGVPVRVPTEATPGGPVPERVGPGLTRETIKGPSGPLLVQTSPLTGHTDPIDKTPKVNVGVNVGPQMEDPYWKSLGSNLGEGDAKVVLKARQATEALDAVNRIRAVHFDTQGNYTGGPAAGTVRLLRDTASQFGIPLDQQTDLNNARMQVELSQQIVSVIVGEGRGITDEDAKRLEKSFPSDKITPTQMPAFLNQYERMLRSTAKRGQEIIDTMDKGSKGKMPTALRPVPIPESNQRIEDMKARIDKMTPAELDAREREILSRQK